MFEYCERLRRFGIGFVAIAAVGLIPLAPASGQDPATSDPPKPAVAQSEWERLIYVPYRNLKQVFAPRRIAYCVAKDFYPFVLDAINASQPDSRIQR